MQLDEYHERLLPAVEDEMASVLSIDRPEYREYFGMMHYHLGWADRHLERLHTQVGKRIRPLICLLVCEAAGGDWEQSLPAAAAIELLHNFSLIHDDIEDDSDTRRGRATVWSVWGIPQAINAGDSMFSAAFHALARLSSRGVGSDTAIEAVKVFALACMQLTKGQHLDMLYEHKANVTVEQYVQMISGKTAALLSATAEIGAIVALADTDRRHNFAQFGYHVGLAFQAYDDYLGVWGDEKSLGKSTASDLLNRKKTLPILYGLAQSADLKHLFQAETIDVPGSIEILNQVGAREHTLQACQDYSDTAVKHLQAASPAGPAAAALRSLTDDLIRRKI